MAHFLKKIIERIAAVAKGTFCGHQAYHFWVRYWRILSRYTSFSAPSESPRKNHNCDYAKTTNVWYDDKINLFNENLGTEAYFNLEAL